MWVLDKEKKILLDAESRVIKSSEVQSLLRSQEIIKLAELGAERIILDAQKKAEKIAADSKVAYVEQEKKGYAAGLEVGKQKIAELLSALSLKEFNNFAGFEERMVNLVTRIIKRILGEINEDELIQRVVKNSLQVIRNQKQAVIKVHPSQVAKVRSTVAEFLKDHSTVEFIDVLPDGRLKPNSCLMETEIGIMDASIDVQLEAIRKSLEKAVNR